MAAKGEVSIVSDVEAAKRDKLKSLTDTLASISPRIAPEQLTEVLNSLLGTLEKVSKLSGISLKTAEAEAAAMAEQDADLRKRAGMLGIEGRKPRPKEPEPAEQE